MCVRVCVCGMFIHVKEGVHVYSTCSTVGSISQVFVYKCVEIADNHLRNSVMVFTW